MTSTPPIDPQQLAEVVRASLRSSADLDPNRTAALMALTQAIMQGGSQPGSPPRNTLIRLGDRWSPLLLMVLSTGRYRHAELRRVASMLSQLAGEGEVSQRMLTLSLRMLERDGFVAREVHVGKVPTVEYRLTPLGEGLSHHIEALMHWCTAHYDQMRAAQEVFDAQAQAPAPANLGWPRQVRR